MLDVFLLKLFKPRSIYVHKARLGDEIVYLCQTLNLGWIGAGNSTLFDTSLHLVLLSGFPNLTWHHRFVHLRCPFVMQNSLQRPIALHDAHIGHLEQISFFQRLPTSRPYLTFLLFNRLLAVGELYLFWKVFIGVWRKCSFGKFQTRLSCQTCVGD